MALNEQISRRLPGRAAPETDTDIAGFGGKLPLPVTLYFLFILFPIHFNAGPIFLTGTRAMLLVVVVPLGIKLLMGKYGRILATDILFFIFSVWNIATLFRNNPELAVSFGGSVAIEFFGGYLLARAYIRTPEAFVAMCRLLFLVIACTIPLAILESRSGTAFLPELIRKLPAINSVPDFYNELAGQRMGLERSQVIFEHPIHYGLFCSTALSLAFIGFKGILSNTRRYLVTAMIVMGVFFSLSSGAILPVVLQFGLIFWAWAFDSVRKRWLILIGLIALAYVVVDLLSNRSPIQVFLSYATFSPHNAYWRVLIFEWGMVNVWNNPLFGMGLNDWIRPWFMHGGSMDNHWLVLAVRYGIPAFFMVAIGEAVVIWRVALRDLEGDRILWQLRRAWVVTMIGLTLTLATVDVWATVYSYVSFLFGAGVWFLVAEPKQADTDETEATGDDRRRPRQDAPRRPRGPVYSRFTPTRKR